MPQSEKHSVHHKTTESAGDAFAAGMRSGREIGHDYALWITLAFLVLFSWACWRIVKAFAFK